MQSRGGGGRTGGQSPLQVVQDGQQFLDEPLLLGQCPGFGLGAAVVERDVLAPPCDEVKDNHAAGDQDGLEERSPARESPDDSGKDIPEE